jgi:ABC-type transporter Mla subunit MlaD
VSKPFTPPVRFTRLLLKVNAFLLIALLLVGAFMGLVAYKQGWFIKQSAVNFVTRSSLGINKGMPVKLFGYTIGSVADLKLTQNGVAVKLSIIAEHLERIPKGSRAKFSRESGVVGASVIEIIPGKPGEPLVEEEFIDFEPARGLSEIIDDFRRQAIPAFNEIKQTMSQFNRSGEEVTSAMIALRREIERIPETHRAVQKLLDSATRATENVERITAEVDRVAPALVGKLSTTLDSLQGAAGSIQRTGREAEEVMQRLKPALALGEAAARDASDIMAAARRSWPLREQFQQSEALLPIDSFEAYGISATPR